MLTTVAKNHNSHAADRKGVVWQDPCWIGRALHSATPVAKRYTPGKVNVGHTYLNGGTTLFSPGVLA